MREEDKIWFDDPEWEELRHEVNGRPFFGDNGRFRLFGKRAEQPPQPPPPIPQPQAPAPQQLRPQAPQGRPQHYVQPAAPRFRTSRPVASQPVQPVVVPDGPKKVSLSLNLTMPNVKVFEHPFVRKIKSIKLTRKQLIMSGAACLVLVSSFGAIRAFTSRNDKDGVEVTTGVLGQSATPEYKPVLPIGGEKSITDNKVLYDPEKKVASYKDTINGIPVTISQQPMPESFNDDPDGEVRKIAENFSANTEIKAGGLTGYLGTSAKGPQSMVLKKRSMLIFIFSEKTIPNDAWGQYISSLE